MRPLRDRLARARAATVPADVVKVLGAGAGIAAVAALVVFHAKLRVVVNFADFDVLARQRAALLRLAPLAADRLEFSGRPVQAVVVLLAAADGEDVDEVALVGAAVDLDHRAAVLLAL